MLTRVRDKSIPRTYLTVKPPVAFGEKRTSKQVTVYGYEPDELLRVVRKLSRDKLAGLSKSVA